MTAQQMEIRRLKEDVIKLQSQCNSMQVQMERLLEKKKGFFKWKKFGMLPSFKGVNVVQKVEEVEEEELESGRETPHDIKTKLMIRSAKPPPKWRKSMS
jgi:hypothetical protein